MTFKLGFGPGSMEKELATETIEACGSVAGTTLDCTDSTYNT